MNESAEYYVQIKKIIPKLKQQLREGTEEEPLLEDEIGHYMIDEKSRSVELTDGPSLGSRAVPRSAVVRSLARQS